MEIRYPSEGILFTTLKTLAYFTVSLKNSY